MKLQHLAIIFVIIILPISLLVGEYVHSQIDTLNLQTSYNAKLKTATYDAMNSFKINTINNQYSTVSDSKSRDVEASISTFYKSLGQELKLNTYYREDLSEFTPALVYTMYDGFYIYSKYKDADTGKYDFGLQPYSYYSCRYKKNESNDIIINYTLDNYISIYGYVGGLYVSKAGNIININNISFVDKNGNKITDLSSGKGNVAKVIYYENDNRKVTIEKEILKENIKYIIDGEIIKENKEYEYVVYNNNKVYYDSVNNKFFTITSSYAKQEIKNPDMLKDLNKKINNGHFWCDSAIKYYVDAYEFTKYCIDNLNWVTQEKAVDKNSTPIDDFEVKVNGNIFNTTNFNNYGDLNITGSTFDLNRLSVIRRCIKNDLLIAIANYNHLSGNTSYEFVLPILNEEDWYNVSNNVSMISFMQGIPLGTKYYNSYCAITNNKNKEVVKLDSLYVITKDVNNKQEVHLANCKRIINEGLEIVGIYKNIDFERKTVVKTKSEVAYYYPHYDEKCYECLINSSELYNIDYLEGKIKKFDSTTEKDEEVTNLTQTQKNTFKELREKILTAIARESYDLYKINDYFRNEGEEEAEQENYSKDITIIQKWDNNHSVTVTFEVKRNRIGSEFKLQVLALDPNISLLGKEWITINDNDEIKYRTNTTEKLKVGDIIRVRLNDGNTRTITHQYIEDTVDPKPPIIDVRYLNENSNPTINIRTNGDEGSGIKALHYVVIDSLGNTIDDKYLTNPEGSYNDISDNYTFSNFKGQYKIIATAIDWGNRSSETSEKIVESKLEAPTITAIGDSKTVDGKTYYTGDLKVKIKDNNVGLNNQLYVKIGNEEPKAVQDGYEEKITNDGETKIEARTKSTATANESDKAELTVIKDTYAPAFNGEFEVVYNRDGGFKLSLAAKDTVSGIGKIEWFYRKDDNSYKDTADDTTYCNGEKTISLNDYTSKLFAVGPGRYHAKAIIYDRVDHKTQTAEIYFTVNNIDKQPGLIIIDPPGANNAQWLNRRVTLGPSSETEVYLNSNPGTIIEYKLNENENYRPMINNRIELNQTQTVIYRYAKGTNYSEDKLITVKIDTTPPSDIQNLVLNKINPYDGVVSSYTSGELTGEDVTLSFSAQDNEGGSGIEKYEYSYDGINVEGIIALSDMQPSWKINYNFDHNIFIRAVDKAGNRSRNWSAPVRIRVTKQLGTVSVDKIDIVRNGNTDPNGDPVTWEMLKSFKLKITTITPPGSFYYVIDWNGNSEYDNEDQIIIPATGAINSETIIESWSGCPYSNVHVCVMDIEGNLGPWSNAVDMRMDEIKPKTTVSPFEVTGTLIEGNSKLRLNINCQDDESGISRIYWYKYPIGGNFELERQCIGVTKNSVNLREIITEDVTNCHNLWYACIVFDRAGNGWTSAPNTVQQQLSEPYYAINNGQVVAAPNAELVHNGGLSDYGVWTNVPGYGVRGLKNSSIHYEATTGNIETKGCKWISITGGYFMEANPCNAVLEVIDSNTGNVKYSESISSAGSLTDNIGKEYDISDCEKVKVRLYIQTDDTRLAWTNIWLTNVNFHD